MKVQKQDRVTQSVNDRRAAETQIAALQKQADALQEKIAVLARGTRDIEPEALPLEARVEAFLRQNTGSIKQIARALNASTEEVEGVIFTFRSAQKVFNVGLETSPEWTLIVGDVPTPELNALVVRLLLKHPLTIKELSAATGARLTRVGGAVVYAQRNHHVLDVAAGAEGRAGRYFIPESARDARLTPKTVDAEGA